MAQGGLLHGLVQCSPKDLVVSEAHFSTMPAVQPVGSSQQQGSLLQHIVGKNGLRVQQHEAGAAVGGICRGRKQEAGRAVALEESAGHVVVHRLLAIDDAKDALAAALETPLRAPSVEPNPQDRRDHSRRHQAPQPRDNSSRPHGPDAGEDR